MNLVRFIHKPIKQRYILAIAFISLFKSLSYIKSSHQGSRSIADKNGIVVVIYCSLALS